MANAQHLRTAADIIRNYGLAKGTYREDRRSACAHCTMGAVVEAIEPVPSGMPVSIWRPGAEELLIEVAKTIDPKYQEPDAQLPFDFHFIISDWNDAEERTADDVIEVLERTAERLEAQS